MNINTRYRIIQGCYWMMFSAGHGYLSYYLSGQGFSPGTIGLVIACAGTASALLQPQLGRIADRDPEIGWKQLLVVLALSCEAAILAVILSSSRIISAVFYGIEITLINSMMPFISSAYFYYEKQPGVKIDFGTARSIGSLSYALLSLLVGQLTLKGGEKPVPVIAAAVMAVLALTSFSMPYDPSKDKTAVNTGIKAKDGILAFLGKHKAFSVMVLATLLMFSFHNMISYYLIQILREVGGDGADLGRAMFIGAVAEIPVMFYFSRIIKKIPPQALLLTAATAYLLRGILMYFASSVLDITLSMLLQFCSYALLVSSMVYYADRSVAPEDKVRGQAFMTLSSSAGSVIGCLVGGRLCTALGVKAMLIFGTGICIAAIAAASASWMIELRRIPAEKEH